MFSFKLKAGFIFFLSLQQSKLPLRQNIDVWLHWLGPPNSLIGVQPGSRWLPQEHMQADESLYWFKWKKEGKQRDANQEGFILSDRRREKGERKWFTQDTRRHQPPETVPLLYTTPLYLLAILNQIMFFIQIIDCNRGT